MENFYHILNIPENADPQDIKKAFRVLAKQCHPDTVSSDIKRFRQITRAYKILSDPESRNDYDKTLNNFRSKSSEFGDYTGNTYSVQGKHLKKMLKEIITQGDFTDIKIKYKGKSLFDLSFPMAAAITFIGLLKAPIVFLLLQLGVAAIFEIEVSNKVMNKFNEALASHNAGKLIQAERSYNEILQKSEYFMPARINLGLLYRQRGEREKAIHCFKQVLNTAPFGEIGDMARKNLKELRGF